MEADNILVLILIAGVAALLVWFEINSRNNDARMKQRPNLTEPASGLPSGIKSNVQSDSENRKAA